MIPEKMLSLLTEAMAQKSKSFLRYRKLGRYLSEDDKFQRVLREIILKEEEHFEELGRIMPRLIAGEGEALSGDPINDDEDGLNNEAVMSNVRAGRVDTFLLNRLLEERENVCDKEDFRSTMPREEKREEEKADVDLDKINDDVFSEGKVTEEIKLMPEGQAWKKFGGMGRVTCYRQPIYHKNPWPQRRFRHMHRKQHRSREGQLV